VATTTFPQYAGDPRGSFLLRYWEERSAREQVRVLAPQTAWCRGEVGERCEVVRFAYAPAKASSLSGQNGIMANLRARPWRALLVAPFWAAFSRAVARELEAFRPDRVVAHWLAPAGWIVAAACARRRVPFELYAHGTDVDLLLLAPGPIQGRFAAHARCAERIWLPSRDKLERLESAGLGLEAAGLGVESMVPWADLAKAAPQAERGEAVLFLGRLIPQKGVDDLLAAVALLSPRVKVDVAGDGPQRRRLERLASRLGVDAEFHGFVEGKRKEALLRGAALVCVPSKQVRGLSEGAPLVVAEALSRGVRVVATDVGGVPELCAGAAGVTLVPPGRPRLLAGALGRALIR
jgi:glycosyltransferase involved in cell wall biosynthesis